MWYIMLLAVFIWNSCLQQYLANRLLNQWERGGVLHTVVTPQAFDWSVLRETLNAGPFQPHESLCNIFNLL